MSSYFKDLVETKNAIEIIDIWSEFLNTFSCTPDINDFPICKVGDIIDDSKSLEWNVRTVERLINARIMEIERLRQVKEDLETDYKNSVIKSLAREYDISIEESKTIWQESYPKGGTFSLYTVYDNYCSFIILYKRLLKLRLEINNG